MDLLEAAIDGGVYNASFDVNQDLALNSQDVFDWLIDAGELRFGPGRRFLPGDANLSGSVDGSDFGIWNTNKFTAARNWCQGDFNQSNAVDGSDFGIWNTNKFQSSDASRPAIGDSGLATASRRGVPLTPHRPTGLGIHRGSGRGASPSGRADGNSLRRRTRAAGGGPTG